MKLPPVIALALTSILLIGLEWSSASSSGSGPAHATATPHRKKKHPGSASGDVTAKTTTENNKSGEKDGSEGGSGVSPTPKPKKRPHQNDDDDEALPKRSSIEPLATPPSGHGKHAGASESGARNLPASGAILPVTPSPTPRKRLADPDDEKPDAAATPMGKKRHQSGAGNLPATPTPTPSKRTTARDDTSAAKPPGTDATAAATPKAPSRYAPSASIPSAELKEFHAQPPRVQALLEDALSLAKLNLTYQYGSDDPVNGGMDCSGSIAYLLRQHGYKDVPRDASGQYAWARQHGQFFAVISKKPGGFEFADLRPGDLMFWIGTYHVDRDPPVTHTMLYLGVQRDRAQQVMWGSSDGRTYEGKQRYGVSVFDFHMPKTDAVNGSGEPVDFIGYAHLPPAADASSAKPERP